MIKPTKRIYNYVFIVFNWEDNKIEGVYINETEAEGKALKLKLKDKHKIAVLKKPVQGKQAPHPIWEW